MSKISLKSSSSGTATFTIESPATNTDRTLVLPNVSGTLVTTGDIPSPTIASTGEAQAGTNNTNFLTPLRLREGFNATGSAPVFACRAFVNFNGTTTTPTIRSSGNVSSVTKIGTGLYLVNFATAMPDANYSVVGLSGGSGGATGDDSAVVLGNVPSSTSQTPTVRFRRFTDNVFVDIQYGSVVVFR